MLELLISFILLRHFKFLFCFNLLKSLIISFSLKTKISESDLIEVKDARDSIIFNLACSNLLLLKAMTSPLLTRDYPTLRLFISVISSLQGKIVESTHKLSYLMSVLNLLDK